MRPWLTAVMPSDVSTVMIGFGLAGRVFHGPLIEAADGLSLDAIVTSNPDRAAQARQLYPNAVIYASVEEAWEGGHSLAVVATPNVTHLPHSVAALEHGLHVVLDKPITATAAEAELLAGLSQDVGRIVIPYQNRRWDSEFRTICEVAASGRLGRIHRLTSQVSKMRVIPRDGWRGSSLPEEMGGQLYDLGSHVIDQAIMLLGPVARVFATARSIRPGHPADDDSTVILEHTSGAVTTFVVSQVTAFPEPRFTLLGTRGGLRIDYYDQQEVTLGAGDYPAPGQAGIDAWDPVEATALMRESDEDNHVTETHIPILPGRWPMFYPQVAKCISEGAEPPVLLSDVISNMRVLDAARASGATGVAIELDPPAGHRSQVV